MLKYLTIAAGLTIAAPALAQQTPGPTVPAPTAAQPATPAAPAEGQAAPAAPAQSQVATIVASEFQSYDKDANGTLDKTEFSGWMAALRKASEPGFDPSAPAAATWMTQAFAQADTDRNSTISQGELIAFLTPKSG